MTLDLISNETGYIFLLNHLLVDNAALSTVLLNHSVTHDKSTATCTQNSPYNESDP